MAQLVIRAGSSEELDTAMGLANELADYSGGWLLPLDEPQAFKLDVPRASDEELCETWRRVMEGENPATAYRDVQGPSYQWRERMRAQVRPGRRSGSSPGLIEIRHKNTGEVLLRVEGDTLEGAYLAGADLDGAGLAGQNLSEAELQGASLIRSDLEGARLCDADLRGVALGRSNLTNADLDKASLWGAPCLEADFTGANLRTADLRGADFTGATFLGADLSEATLMGAWFGCAYYDAQTRWPKGFNPRLQSARHVGWFLEGLQPETTVIDEAQAIEIARRTVAANESWVDRATYEARLEDGCWLVHVLRIEGYEADGTPQWTFGGDRFVEIETNGRVVRYS